jgi:hypothetical protein
LREAEHDLDHGDQVEALDHLEADSITWKPTWCGHSATATDVPHEELGEQLGEQLS